MAEEVCHSCFLPAALMECHWESSTKAQMLSGRTIVWKAVDRRFLSSSHLYETVCPLWVAPFVSSVPLWSRWCRLYVCVLLVFAKGASLLLLIFKVSDVSILNPETDMNDSTNHVSCCCVSVFIYFHLAYKSKKNRKKSHRFTVLLLLIFWLWLFQSHSQRNLRPTVKEEPSHI